MTAPDPAAIRHNTAVFAAEIDRIARTEGSDVALLEAAALLQAAYLTLSAVADPGQLAYDVARLAREIEAPPLMGWGTTGVSRPPAELIDDRSHSLARALRMVQNADGPHVAIERASAAFLVGSRALAWLAGGSVAATVLQGYAGLAVNVASAIEAGEDLSMPVLQ